MKVGDRVYCIKEYQSSYNRCVYYKKDHIYVISAIISTTRKISPLSSIKNDTYIFNYYKIPFINKNGHENSANIGENLISKYFLSTNEYRKQKLKKLNGTL